MAICLKNRIFREDHSTVSEMKIIGFYADSFEASLVQGQLVNAGIQACLLNEYVNEVMPWGSDSDRAVRVGVADEDYAAAMAVLAPEGSEEAEAAVPKACPFCGSEQVSLGLRGPKRWRKILWTALAALTMSPPGKVRANYYCRECRREF